MFKDKQLREALKEVGILKPDLELYRSYDWMTYVGEIAQKRIDVGRIKTDVERLHKENKELKQHIDAMMELLGITYEEAHKEPAKLKKGKKEVEIKADKSPDKKSDTSYLSRSQLEGLQMGRQGLSYY